MSAEPEPELIPKRKRKHNPDQEWLETTLHPTKGPKGDTAFLYENYKFSTIGSIFRTPKARFTESQIRDGATKAGWAVRVDVEGLWHKVTVTGKLPRQVPAKPKQDFYLGAGKKYPPVEPDIFS
jgi:hypothetical protein